MNVLIYGSTKFRISPLWLANDCCVRDRPQQCTSKRRQLCRLVVLKRLDCRHRCRRNAMIYRVGEKTKKNHSDSYSDHRDLIDGPMSCTLIERDRTRFVSDGVHVGFYAIKYKLVGCSVRRNFRR